MEDNDKIIQPKPNRKSTLRLTQEFNEKYFTQFRKSLLHRPKRKMRQNVVMIYIFYNYVSNNLLNVLV
jgi:hypothetical protein